MTKKIVTINIIRTVLFLFIFALLGNWLGYANVDNTCEHSIPFKLCIAQQDHFIQVWLVSVGIGLISAFLLTWFINLILLKHLNSSLPKKNPNSS